MSGAEFCLRQKGWDSAERLASTHFCMRLVTSENGQSLHGLLGAVDAIPLATVAYRHAPMRRHLLKDGMKR